MTSVEINPPATDFRNPVVPPELNEAARLELLEQLTGFPTTASPELDRFAGQIHDITGGTWQGVNRIGKGGKQRFPGLSIAGLAEIPDAYRDMEYDYGFCRQVEERGQALIIQDTREYAPFATNPVVLNFDVRAYIGVPLRLPDGRFIGTIWSINMGESRRDWGQSHLDAMKALALHVVEYLLSHSPDFE